MANDPVSEATPSPASGPPLEAVTGPTAPVAPNGEPDAPPAADATALGGTGIAAGPAPQVLFTGQVPAPAPTTAPAAKPGEELIGSWLTSHLYKVDVPYAGLVVVLAFLLGSFAASNPDIWTQLATGRLLNEGKYEFGVDPFAYTTRAGEGRPAVPWINHSWLSSWVAYLLYSADGTGMVLVAVKAVAVAGLALLLLLLRPNNRHGWAGTVIVLLTMIVLSPRLEANSLIVSIFFLAATAYFLHRGGVFALSAEGAQPTWLWALPFLFALWVNMDGFFILGPLTVLLALIGLLIGAKLGHKPSVCVRQLGTVLAVSIVACLANPHHYRALIRVPPEIAYLLLHLGNFWPESVVAGGRAFMDFRAAVPNFSRTVSPLTAYYLTDMNLGKNVAGIGFFVLLVVVLASFYVGKSKNLAATLARMIPTAALAVVSLMLIRLIGFFAVLGGMVAIWNFQEFLAQREEAEPARIEEHNVWANMIRLVGGFLVFGLFFLAWPGWINATVGDFSSPRRVAWKVAEDPSLKNASDYLVKMNQEGKLERCFNLSPDIASFCSWHAPGLTFFIDPRFELFDRDTRMYNQLREALTAEVLPSRDPRITVVDWRQRFATLQIDHIVGTTPLARALTVWAWKGPYDLKTRWETTAPVELESIYADGRTFVLAWRTALRQPLASVEAQWHEAVFGKHKAPLSEAPRPPAEDVAFWTLYSQGQKPEPLESQEAATALAYQTEIRSAFPRWSLPYLCASEAATWPMFTIGSNPLPLCAILNYFDEKMPDPKHLKKGEKVQFHPELWCVQKRVLYGQFPLQGRDLGEPAAVLFAMRKARQAIAESPNDARSYQTLAKAVGAIDLIEAHWSGTPPYLRRNTLLANVRNLQQVAAMRHYVMLNPNEYLGRWLLGQIYLSQNFLDLAAEQMEAAVKLLENAKSPDLFQLKAKYEDELQGVKAALEKRRDQFDFESRKMSDVQKAFFAVNGQYKEFVTERGEEKQKAMGTFGLVGQARKLLQETPSATLSDQEKLAASEFGLHLALITGNLWEMEDLLGKKAGNEVLEKNPGLYKYKFMFDAAKGDYASAQDVAKKLDAYSEMGVTQSLVGFTRSLGFSQFDPQIRLASRLNFEFFFSQYNGLANQELAGLVINAADRQLLLGVFALESGDSIAARAYFEKSRRIAGPRFFFMDRPVAVRYEQLIQP